MQRIVLLPMAVATLLVLGLVLAQYQQRVSESRAAALRTAHALSVAVTHELDELQTGLKVLGTAASLARGDLAQFYERAVAVHPQLGVTRIALLDETGRQVVNTARRWGEEPPHLGANAPTLMVIRTGKPMAKVLMAPLENRYVAAVSVPVYVEGQVRYALTTVIPLQSFQGMFAGQQMPTAWIAAVVDEDGITAARTHQSDQFVGKLTTEPFRKALATGTAGTFDGVTLDGIPVVTAFAKSPDTGWAVGIGIPKVELTRDLTRSLTWLAIGVSAILLMMTALAWKHGRSAEDSLASLVAAAEQLGKGKQVDLPPMRLQEAERLAAALKQSGRELAARHADLAGNEARWTAVLDSATDGILSVDDSLRIVVYNRAAERIFGWSAPEMLGQSVSRLLPKPAELSVLAPSPENPGGARTMRGLRRSGEAFPVEASVSEAQTPVGRLRTIIARDVSELHRTREIMAKLSRQAAGAREQEKARIARELHDELAQTLSTLKLQARSLAARLPGDAQAQADLGEMVAMLDDGVAATRRIAADLRPMILDDLGLHAAIRSLADNFTRRTGVQCILHIPGAHGIEEPLATAAFRIVQEALQNVSKHARATVVRVGVTQNDDVLEVSIDDDGAGFASEQPRRAEALGLVGLRERAQLLQGTLEVDSAPGRGTRILATLPLGTDDPESAMI